MSANSIFQNPSSDYLLNKDQELNLLRDQGIWLKLDWTELNQPHYLNVFFVFFLLSVQNALFQD